MESGSAASAADPKRQFICRSFAGFRFFLFRLGHAVAFGGLSGAEEQARQGRARLFCRGGRRARERAGHMMGDIPQLRNPAGGLSRRFGLPGGTGSRLHAVFLRSRDLRRGGRCGNGSGGLRLILFCFPIEAAAGIWPIRQGTVVAIGGDPYRGTKVTAGVAVTEPVFELGGTAPDDSFFLPVGWDFKVDAPGVSGLVSAVRGICHPP